PLVNADACPGQAIAFGRRALAERQHAGAEHLAIARQRELTLERPGIGDTQHFVQVHQSTYTTDETIMPKPTATNVRPTTSLNRTVVVSFSIVSSTPSAAIHTTFIAPTANITSIIAQQH